MADTTKPTQDTGCGGVMLDLPAGPGPVRLLPASQTPDGIKRWVVTRHTDVVAALTDARLSNTRAYTTAEATDSGHDTDQLRHSMIATDPPDHSRLRKLVVRAFSAKRIEALRPRVQQIADQLLDVATRDQVDLVQAFAFPLPVRVICELLGVPDHMRDRLLRLAAAPATSPNLVPMDAVHPAMAELIDARRTQPGDDLLSDLVTAHDEEKLTDPELIQMAGLLFAAGHVTTVTLITNAIVTLLQHPDQLTDLRRDPSLVSQAVDELLRHAGPVPAVARYALDRIKIDGVTIPKGSHVSIALTTANHDPDKFTDPDRFDIHRRGGGDVAFGHGIHFCLGARLAKLETEVAIATLLRRFPDLALANAPGRRCCAALMPSPSTRPASPGEPASPNPP